MAPITSKVVVINGSSRGIGLEFARLLLSQGNRVIAAARTPESSPGLAALAQLHPSSLKTTTLDVTIPESIAKCANDISQLTPKVDLLINSAGIRENLRDLGQLTQDVMMDLYRTNAVGPLLLTQQLANAGLLGQGSMVANITSKMGSVYDNGSGGSYAYRASKSALNIINKSMAIDLQGMGVACVLLHPGWVRTDMTGGSGLVDADFSVAGMVKVLETKETLNGKWYDYKGGEIPW